jgi:hypothetical protein
MDKKPTLEEAQEILKQAEMEKQKKCFAEIEIILKKYGYQLGTTQPQVIFIPKNV